MISLSNTHSAKSIDEYISIIRELRKTNESLWFRGHSSSDYRLTPSMFRSPFAATATANEYSFMGSFKSKAIRYVQRPMSDDREIAYFQWLFIMQHYGTPTRLLDWSQNALIALAFATQYREGVPDNKSADVWCLNPRKLNATVRYAEYELNPIPNICELSSLRRMYSKGSDLGKITNPIAIVGLHETERIIAQNGVFTLFPDRPPFALEDLPNASDYLYRITLANNCIDEIAHDLFYIGISETTLFPELESISKEIRREHIERIATT